MFFPVAQAPGLRDSDEQRARQPKRAHGR